MAIMRDALVNRAIMLDLLGLGKFGGKEKPGPCSFPRQK
jgi:hypothetical protein